VSKPIKWICWGLGSISGYSFESSIAFALSMKYGSLVIQISMVGGITSFEFSGYLDNRSLANRFIIRRRCGKDAGLAALSAFWMERRRRSREERRVFVERAEVAMCRWARVGGLNDESRIQRVEGSGVVPCFDLFKVETMRKVLSDLAKSLSMLVKSLRYFRISPGSIGIAVSSSLKCCCRRRHTVEDLRRDHLGDIIEVIQTPTISLQSIH